MVEERRMIADVAATGKGSRVCKGHPAKGPARAQTRAAVTSAATTSLLTHVRPSERCGASSRELLRSLYEYPLYPARSNATWRRRKNIANYCKVIQ